MVKILILTIFMKNTGSFISQSKGQQVANLSLMTIVRVLAALLLLQQHLQD